MCVNKHVCPGTPQLMSEGWGWWMRRKDEDWGAWNWDSYAFLDMEAEWGSGSGKIYSKCERDLRGGSEQPSQRSPRRDSAKGVFGWVVGKGCLAAWFTAWEDAALPSVTSGPIGADSWALT